MQASTTFESNSQNKPVRERKSESFAHEPETGRSIATESETEFGMSSSESDTNHNDGLHKSIQEICARLDVSIVFTYLYL